MIRRPPRSTLDRSSAASDVYKRQWQILQAREYAAIQIGAGIEQTVVAGTKPEFQREIFSRFYTDDSFHDPS